MITEKNEIPNYGDLFTIEEFIDYCEDGMFIDWDGNGLYSDGKFIYGSSGKYVVYPSDIVAGNIRKKFSHVMWFNK